MSNCIHPSTQKSQAIRRISLICATTLAAASAAASETKAPLLLEELEVSGQQSPNYLLKQSRGATKLALDLADTPQSVSIIGREQMNDFQLDNIQSALRQAPGISVEAVETERTYFTARGFEVTNFQVDGLGLPLNSGHTQGDRDTALYERIEVVRGANGLMTGVGDPSATINMIRKRPTDDTLFQLNASYGSWDNARFELDAGGHLSDRVGTRAVLVKQDKESHLDRYSLDKSVFYLAMDFDITERTLLTLGHSFERSDSDSPLWGALPLYYSDGSATDFDSSTSTAADWAFWDQDTQKSFVDLTHQFNSDWSLTAAYNYSTVKEDSNLFYVYGTPDASTGLGLTGYASDYRLRSEEQAGDIYLSGSFYTGAREHQLVLGGNWAEYDYTDRSLYDYTTGNGFPALPPLQNFDGDAPVPTLVDGERGSDSRDQQSSFYASARFELFEQLHLITGARSVDWQTRGESYGRDTTSDARETVPYVGLTWGFADRFNAYASYTEVFNPQTEQDINGKRLAPVTGESREVGVKGQFFDDKLLASIAWFDSEQRGLATSAGFDLDSGREYFRAADGIQSKGYELELVGELLPGLQTSLGYSDFDIEGDDDVSDYTPERLFKLAASYQLGDLRVGANLNWQDDTRRVQVRDSNGAAQVVSEQDAYALLNLMASYNLTEQLKVAFNANNVTDEKYYSSLKWAQAYYGAPRNYSVSVAYQF